jgi:single-strand DNA-binding protein
MPYSSVNRVTLVGNLTRDPELRSLPSGRSVCHLRLACNDCHYSMQGVSERPNYFNVSVFGNQAENVYRYTCKGRSIAVDGRLRWSEWETDNQSRREEVRVVAQKVQLLGPRIEENKVEVSPDYVEHRELVTVGAGDSTDEDLIL